MPDIKDYEIHGYFCILFNFTYICLFLPDEPSASLEVLIFSVIQAFVWTYFFFFVARRPNTNRQQSEFWIWKWSLNVVSYLGIMMMLLKKLDFLQMKLEYPMPSIQFKIDDGSVKSLAIVMVIEHSIIIWKFLLAFSVNPLSKWVLKRMRFENYNRKKARDASCSKMQTLQKEGGADLREKEEIEFERAFD